MRQGIVRYALVCVDWLGRFWVRSFLVNVRSFVGTWITRRQHRSVGVATNPSEERLRSQSRLLVEEYQRNDEWKNGTAHGPQLVLRTEGW